MVSVLLTIALFTQTHMRAHMCARTHTHATESLVFFSLEGVFLPLYELPPGSFVGTFFDAELP